MGILFISHSSQDNDAAIKVRNWLKDNGWGQIFLDLDPSQGLAPGHRWQQELKQAGERCSGVIVLISPDWVASRWCQTEFLLADQLGKRIFPLFIAPTPFDDLPVELKAKFQFADISAPEKEAEGFERLAIGLKRAGLDPKSFEWPPPNEPHRPIYRGLQSLEEQDAAIFFGRDALITKGLDALRRMRDGSPERMLVILGASGAGKSSFLKAGLIARLRRDEENFLVPPVIRPGRAALTGHQGFAASIGSDPARLNGPDDLNVAFAKLRAPVMGRLKRIAESTHESYSATTPTIVIALDQAEELCAAESVESERTIELLAAAVRADQNVIIVATIRSDAFAKLQSEPKFADVVRLPFDLAPIAHGAFKEVIEGPARLANPPLAIEPVLTDRLLNDLAADDALPLLAFTLERLSLRHHGGGTLTLSDYVDELGGLRGAIVAAVDAALASAARDPALPAERAELEQLARSAFIPFLVQLDHTDAEPKRRVERASALPETTRALVRHLVDQRLLVSNRSTIDGIETDTIEVAHEAILRQWPSLRAWIAKERDALRTLDSVRAAAREWRAHKDEGNAKQGHSWLVHRGDRLQDAETLQTQPGFTTALGSAGLEYLAACRVNENAELLREKLGLGRTRRLQRNVGVLIAIAAAVVLLGACGVLQLLTGLVARTSDSLAGLAASQAAIGEYDSAARYAVASLEEADWPLVGSSNSEAEVELAGASAVSSTLVVLPASSASISQFSSDGTRILTIPPDKTARIWDAKTGREIVVLRGHKGYVESAMFSPDGARVVTTSRDKTARIWDAKRGHQIVVLRGHEDVVGYGTFSPDGARVVTASRDRTARIWNARTGREMVVLRGHGGEVYRADFSPDGTRIVTASQDKTARIWDAQTGREILVLPGPEFPIATFSHDGTRILTVSQARTARIWNVETNREMIVLRGHGDDAFSAVFSPDDARVVTTSGDRTARIWDAKTGQQIAVASGHEGAVWDAVFSPDGKRIATASADRTARIWDADTGRALIMLRGHQDAVFRAAFSPDGTRIFTASEDGTERIWNVSPGGSVTILSGDTKPVVSAGFSRDGARIVTASYDGTARVWEAKTGREIAVLQEASYLDGATFSPEGARIVTASSDGTARVWDARTAQVIAVLRGHEDRVTGAAISPDGLRVATASADKTARIWNVKTGQVIRVFRGHEETVNSVNFSPDGLRIVTASDDKTARIWDAKTGQMIRVLRRHEDAVNSAVFSPQGARILTASSDKTARIWNARSGFETAILRGHENAVESAAFSLDGSRIVTASDDRTARLWDAKSGRQIAVFRGHERKVMSAAFSPDGKNIVTASEDHTARIWPVGSQVLLPRAKLINWACTVILAHGLSRFTEQELRAAPVLDPRLDADACHPPGFWTRLGRIFLAASQQVSLH